MGLGRNKDILLGAFDSSDDSRKLKMRKVKELREDFANQKVFGLTGKLVKRSKGFR